jgi:hypothetical protein
MKFGMHGMDSAMQAHVAAGFEELLADTFKRFLETAGDSGVIYMFTTEDSATIARAPRKRTAAAASHA